MIQKPDYAVDGSNPTDALLFALASRLAYAERDDAADDEAIEEKARAWQFDRAEVCEVARGRDVDTQGHVACGPERVLIAFRGDGVGARLANGPAGCDRPGHLVRHVSSRGFLGRVRDG